MNLYLSNSHSDEDDDTPVTKGKFAMIYGSKSEILELCKFFSKVEQSLIENDRCHLHFRDHLTGWDRNLYIDIEVNAEN